MVSGILFQITAAMGKYQVPDFVVVEKRTGNHVVDIHRFLCERLVTI